MKIGYADFAYRDSLNAFYNIKAVKYYLLNTSFNAFAGKNLTFWDAAI